MSFSLTATPPTTLLTFRRMTPPLQTDSARLAPSERLHLEPTIRKNVERDEGVILSHICWGPGAPLPFSWPQTPPPPALKLAGKWEGVGVWPDATPPPLPPPPPSLPIQPCPPPIALIILRNSSGTVGHCAWSMVSMAKQTSQDQ